MTVSLLTSRATAVHARGAAPLGRLLAVALACCAAACSSSKNGKLDLSRKEQLGLYLENAAYYIELGDLDRAQFQAEKGLELDPENERFQLIRVRTNLMRGDAQSIETALVELERKPDLKDWRWQMTLGEVLERKGVLYDEAARGVRDGQRATKAADPLARASELQAEAQAFWRRARVHFERALPQRTGEPEILNGLVRTSALLNDFETSLTWSEELLKSIAEAQYLSRSQLEAPDITADREKKLRGAQRKNREFELQVRLHRATLLRNVGRGADAVREIDAVIELDPRLAQPHSLRGQLFFELGEFVKARASLARFLQETDLPFDDPQVRRAFDLQDECDRRLRGSE